MKKVNKIIILLLVIFQVKYVYALDYITKDNMICTETEEHKAWAKLSDEQKKKSFEPILCKETIEIYSRSLTGFENVKSIGNVDYKTASKFDLRNVNGKNYVTPYKEQLIDYVLDSEGNKTFDSNNHAIGTDSYLCWAFATNSAVESAYLTEGGGELDLSERHIGFIATRTLSDGTINPFGYYNHTVTSAGEDNGGNFFMSGSYLIQQRGPILDNKLTVNTKQSTKANTLDVKADYAVENVIYSFANSCQDENAILNIKRLLTTYGAVTGLMTGKLEAVSDNETSVYYHTTDSKDTPGHAMTIVGWDDNYPKENFKASNGRTPAGNGAWIVKNTYSWFGNNDENLGEGYHYTSYYDEFACGFNMAIDSVSDKTSNNIYYYDSLGYNTGAAIPYDNLFLKQIFNKKSSGTEHLNKISLYGNVNDSYEIYYSVEDDFSKATKIANGTFNETGYKSVTLSNGISITSSKFYIFVKYHSNNKNIDDNTSYVYPIQYIPFSSIGDDGNYYISNPTKSVTFYGIDGNTWQDTLSDTTFMFYPLVHAYTNNIDYGISLGTPKASNNASIINIIDGGYYDIPLSLTKISIDDVTIKVYKNNNGNVQGSGTDVTDDFEISKSDNNIRVSIKKDVTKSGTYTVEASYNQVSATKTITIAANSNILVTKITISGGNEVAVNGTLNLTAKIEPENATVKTLKWASSDTKIATVDENGVVTGIRDGNVVISAISTDGSDARGTISIKVIDINKEEGNGVTPPNENNSNPSGSTNTNNPNTGLPEYLLPLASILLIGALILIQAKKYNLFKNIK